MRVLMTSNPGDGHWRPLAGLANVLLAAGHEAAFVATPETCLILRSHGFLCYPVGVDDDGGVERGGRHSDRHAVDPAVEVWLHIFAGRRIDQMFPEMLTVAKAWQPDLIIREISEYSGALVAELLGIPLAVLQVSSWRPHLYAAISNSLNQWRGRLGLPLEDPADFLHRWFLLSPEPPAYRTPGPSYPTATYPLTLPIYDAKDPGDEAARLPVAGARPRIYATLGTAYNRRPDLFKMILAATRALEHELVMTTGLDPDELGISAPAGAVHLRDYIPLSEVLPTCDLVISHGGYGTVQAALRHGLPQALLPLAADQPDNARLCEVHGAGAVLWEGERSEEGLRRVIEMILYDRSYRQPACDWQRAIESLPGPAEAVQLLEGLASR